MTEEALTLRPVNDPALKHEFGPVGRWLAQRFFEDVRFPQSAEKDLADLSRRGFVVHVMRTDAWINFLYLTWALIRRRLPTIRAVANLRRWFTRPFTLNKLSGDFAERFAHAKKENASALIFLRKSAFNSARGVDAGDDPFPALVEMARASEQSVFLVPELFVWEKWQQKIAPSLFDRIFGAPEAPGFLHSVGAFMRNYKRAQFRMGEPIDLKRVIADSPGESTALIARKVRSALHHHLARETRAVFGPPAKSTDRLIEEAMRDKAFQKVVEAVSREKGKPVAVIERQARSNFNEIAARYSPTWVGFSGPLLDGIFNRIYDGVEVDEAGLERAMKAAAHAPMVLTPSHKSHIDYMIMSYVLFQRGYQVPLVAAGANLSFFPLGIYFRRVGAFFLRRSFKGDALYTAVFKAYLKKLVHDGIHHEFFPEGGRSRTGKLLAPKLGMFTWLVEAVLDGARNDLLFVPTAIDYERVVEGSSYKAELQGGEKKPEDIKALLSAPKVLTQNYGRIHLSFDEPVSLAALMRDRGLVIGQEVSEDDKRSLVRALANRVMYGISRASTVTPHALLASSLLAHRRRGISVREVTDRVGLLRRMVTELGASLSRQLTDSPSSPTVLGSIHDAMHGFASDGFVRIVEARGEPIYQVDDEHRSEMSFYKNTLLNLVAGRTIVAASLLASEPDSHVAAVREKALFLSRLFKLEFIYPVGKSFEVIFDETVEHLHRLGLVVRDSENIAIAPEAHARPQVEFIGDLIRDYLESYLIGARQAAEVPAAGQEKKDFVKRALESGRADYLAGVVTASEALSKTNLDNTVLFLVDQGYLSDSGKRVAPGTKPVAELVAQIRAFLPDSR